MSSVHSATVIAKTPSLKGCLPNILNLGQEPRRKPRAGGRGFPSGVRVTVVSAFHPPESKRPPRPMRIGPKRVSGCSSRDTPSWKGRPSPLCCFHRLDRLGLKQIHLAKPILNPSHLVLLSA